MRKKWVSSFMTLLITTALTGQTIMAPLQVSAKAEPAFSEQMGEAVPAALEQFPDPVFNLDFENITEHADAVLTGTLQAATGEAVTIHDYVTVAEGRNAGKAVVLDNTAGKSGYLSTANTDALNPKDMTVSVWLKRIHSVNNTEGRIIWNKEGTETNGNCWKSDGWFLGWTNGEAMAFVTDGSNLAVQKGNPDDLIPENQWTNITSVFDSASGEMIVYKNGQKLAYQQAAGAGITKNVNAAELLIGKSGYGNVGIGCAVDDIQIFNTAFDAKQVGELADLTAQDYLDADMEKLTVAQRVSGDFTLPSIGANGSDIAWTSDSNAIQIKADGQAAVTRGEEDIPVKLTAALTYGSLTDTKEFLVTVVKKNQPAEGFRKLSYSEIVDISGTIGTRLKDSMKNYGMDYLYGQKMSDYLAEYKNHSHSAWSWLEGEQPGKWLESMSNSRWMDTDGSIKAAIADVVNQLAAAQTKEDRSAAGFNQFSGYLGNATADIRNSKPVKGMDPYEMYSTLNGLINVYEVYKTDDRELAEKAYACAVNLADYLTATIGDENTKALYQDGTESNMNKVEFWPLVNQNGTTIAGHDVHQSWEGTLLIDPMMQLSRAVRDDTQRSKKYSDWVDWAIQNIDKWASGWGGYGDTPYADLDKVASGEMGIDEIQHYVHAHTFQMNFLGFLKKYQETGDAAYLNKVAGAWEDIVSRQKYITGTVSVGEHYEAGHNLPNTGSVGETCATNSWTLLNNNLFELTGEAKYQQTVEEVLYNHMFATSTIDGDGYSYHRPLNGTTDRFFTGPDCCSSSGMRMQSYIPYYLYSKSDTGIYVNQFVASEVKIAMPDGTMHLKQTTDYPETDDVKLEVMPDSAGGMLHIRVPDWVSAPSIKINGKTAGTAVIPGEYASVSVSAGDVIEITYPSEPVWVKGDNSNEGLWAVKKGPMVYCLASAFMSIEESQAAFGTDIAKVTASSVWKPEAGKALEIEGTVDFKEERILGKGYQVKMNTPKGEQTVTIVPYANIGQWYRIGENRPTDYNAAGRYPYLIWMSAMMTDYPEEPDPETKPVVHYDFDTADGVTVKDISGNGHDAVLQGGAAIQEGGRLEKAAQLNGSDGCIQLPEDVLYGLYNMTISVWVKPEELGSWARIFDFGSKQNPPFPNLFLTANSGGNNLRLAYEDGDNSHIDGGAVIKTGEWQHLAVALNGSKATLYLDGRKVGENAGFHFTPVMTSKMISNMLGKSNYANDKYFKGGMDDFRIYNRAISEKEITALSNGEEPVRVIQSVMNPDAVETMAGTAPVLPAKASVSYEDGTNGKELIVWEEIPGEKYAKPGSFEVSGKVGSLDVRITVLVKENGGQEPDKPIAVERVSMSGTGYTLELYEAVTLKAVIFPENADNQGVIWKSSDPGIAAADQSGRVTAQKPGKAVITVTTIDGQKTASCMITVKTPVIKLNYSKLSLQVKKSTTLVGLKSSSVKGEKIKSAKSGSPKLVSVKVKKGKLFITGRKTGTSVITVTSTNGGTAKIKITVKKKVSVSGLIMDRKKAAVKKGKRISLKVTKKPVTAANTIKWKTSNSKIASVSSKGVVKTKKKGKVTITAVSSNGKKAVCRITVK